MKQKTKALLKAKKTENRPKKSDNDYTGMFYHRYEPLFNGGYVLPTYILFINLSCSLLIIYFLCLLLNFCIATFEYFLLPAAF